MTDLTNLAIPALHRLLETGQITAVELAKAFLAAIRQREPQISAFLTVTEERALADAQAADARIRTLRAEGSPLPPLLGIPMALKDNICTKGIRTTCASRMLENFVPPYDATAAERLALAGAPLLGKLNMDEFAVGISTETSAFYPTKNPLDPTLVPGGSSGGSAAAVAAGEAAFSLGSDTGGSVRQPAAFCGVVGMKPTYGRISRYGLVAHASSLDQIGPVTRTVAENALVLEAISGPDGKDATALPFPPGSFSDVLEKGAKNLRIGLVSEFFSDIVDPAVRDAVLAAAGTLEKAGAGVEYVSLPSAEDALIAYMAISAAELSSNLARFDGVRYGKRANHDTLSALYQNSRFEGFGKTIKERILAGAMLLSSEENAYGKALAVRDTLREEFARLFARFDALISPVSPRMPRPLGIKLSEQELWYADFCTIPASLAGLPALSVPCGFVRGLPCGLQIMGPALSEGLLYRIGRAVELTNRLAKEGA